MPAARPIPPPPALQEGVELAPRTTLGIGGPARCFLDARDVAEVRHGLAWASQEGLPVFVLGGGSNVLVADRGFDGLVLGVGLRGVERHDDPHGVRLRVGAGEPWDPFVARCVAAGLAGVECLSGIPGLVGATPIQNVGAYGQEVCETIVEVEAVERASGQLQRFTPEACRFGYRDSFFKREGRDRFVVVAVSFLLRPGGAAAVRYPDLERALGERGVDHGDLGAVREAVVEIRRSKGMVLDPDDPDSRSDGSFFMNPVLSVAEHERFAERVRRELGPQAAPAPGFPMEGGVKVPAAWLIERAGFGKGHRHGRVGLSSKHALAIVNRGGGTAAEVLELVTAIQGRVRERFGVHLEPEPNFVGLPSPRPV